MPFSRDELPGERAVAGAPTVAHLVPEYLPLVRGVLEARPDTGPLVSHTVWETDRVPAHWPALLNDVDLIVVPSEWNRQVFAEGGVTTPSVAVPHVVCDPVPGSDDAMAALGLPDDVVVFYAIGRWDERKAMFHTVRADLEAFTADDPVVLVVKTGVRIEMPPAEGWGADTRFAYTTGWQVAQLVRHYARPAAVRVEPATWTDDQVAALHTRGDCFVGLARGEGWGIGAFDACAYGNPVIATGWGGYLEFLTPEHASLVDHELVHVHHHAYASYSADQRWAEPSIEHAAHQMREVARDLHGARTGPPRSRLECSRSSAPTRWRVDSSTRSTRTTSVADRARCRGRAPAMRARGAATVDDHVAAGHERRVVGGEEQHRVRDLDRARGAVPRARPASQIDAKRSADTAGSWIIGVSTGPGSTALTRMSGASSNAADLVRPRTAHFELV